MLVAGAFAPSPAAQCAGATLADRSPAERNRSDFAAADAPSFPKRLKTFDGEVTKISTACDAMEPAR
jgi:hypothetical protein